MQSVWWSLSLLTTVAGAVSGGGGKREFRIDYEQNGFVKDGQPWSYISGSIHYFRVPAYYWRDRLLRIKAGGLNAIQTYIPWNIHEMRQGTYDFTGDKDVFTFLKTAGELDLAVILRIGPYTCGEWDFGGLPWWINNYPGIKPRTSDTKWLELVGTWWDVLLPKLVPYLYRNGGPIILVQIENEYGSRAQSCDAIEYKSMLRDRAHALLGFETQLITVDGGALSYLRCGTIPTVYPTIDFGPESPEGMETAFHAQRDYAPRGPLINSEFYPGWLDVWGSAYDAGNPAYQIASSMRSFAALNASYNFYMYHGGSNFGYWPSRYVTTSYDYGAPLSEAGNYTASFSLIRGLIKQLTGREAGTPPPANKAMAYGTIQLRRSGSFYDLLGKLSPSSTRRRSPYPLNACALEHPYGFLLYSTRLPSSAANVNLKVPGLGDRAQVFLNQEYVGALAAQTIGSRQACLNLSLDTVSAGDNLDILVENMGRNADGTVLDPKGLTANVTLDGRILRSWLQFPITMENLLSDGASGASRHPRRRRVKRSRRSQRDGAFVPSIYQGTFRVDKAADSYLNPSGWGKGQVFVNGVNLGRYWPSMGPQLTLYAPKGVFREGAPNTLTLFELERGNCDAKSPSRCSVRFDAVPVLNATIH